MTGPRALELVKVARGEGVAATARRLGYHLTTVQAWRRALGLRYPQNNKGRTPVPDEQDDETPGCKVCGLRGEHLCLRGDAQDRRER